MSDTPPIPETGSADRLLSEFLRLHDVPCPHCGYNLRSLTGTRCPECGEPLRLQVASSFGAVSEAYGSAVTACVLAQVGSAAVAVCLLLNTGNGVRRSVRTAIERFQYDGFSEYWWKMPGSSVFLIAAEAALLIIALGWLLLYRHKFCGWSVRMQRVSAAAAWASLGVLFFLVARVLDPA